MPNNHSNPDSNRHPEDDPDLGFASDSHVPFGPPHRKAFEQSSSDIQGSDDTDAVHWSPDALPQEPDGSGTGVSDSGTNDVDPDDTWVPSDGPINDPGGADPNKTWVPSKTPTADGLSHPPASPEDIDDPNKTWTPVHSPTTDGLPPRNEQNDQDPNQTWVPSNTPTADGLSPADTQLPEPQDPNKTWTPSNTPTADGLSREAEADDDFEKTWVPNDSQTIDSPTPPKIDDTDSNRTWVPSSTPTTEGISSESDNFDSGSTWVMDPPPSADSSGESIDDANKTRVPSTTPTTSGSRKTDLPVDLTETVDLDQAANSSEPGTGFEDTVELERPSSGSNESPNQSTANSGDVFQKTIGMRRPLDSSDLPPSPLCDSDAGQTIHLDLPDGELNRGSSHSTQLWARQSGLDLNHSLTIRSRPVTGDKQFEVAETLPDKPDYQIVEKIGEGGMGAIFLANQTSLDRQLAIKTLKATRAHGSGASSGSPSGSVDRQRRDMFLAEALITANLVHPHIIPIHDLCETADGLPFYSMKRVVGTPWCDRLRDMDQDDNLEVLMKVCDAVAYAHHNGVVNRDLKPENVMLGEFGEVLVLDWGLAVPSSAADKKKFNSPSAPYGAGTPAYMAPELWTGPEEIIGYWSDIYLLGAILFEIITGKAPHKFAEPATKAGNTGLWMVIDKVVRRNDIRETSHKGELMDIALKAMETRPKDRFASVLKFQEALKNFQEHEESRRLSGRAIQTLDATTDAAIDTGYLSYQSAAALFEEAQATWPENEEAVEGLRETRLQYAALAHKKGDFDLGLQIAELEDEPSFVDIRNKLSRSRRIRNTLKSAVIAASAIIVAVGIFSFIQSREIAQQNDQIIALNGTRETLLSDISAAQQDILDAESKRKDADNKAVAAEQRAIAATKKAEEASSLVAAAEMKLKESAKKLEAADEQLIVASGKLDLADRKLAVADQTLAQTEKKVEELEVKKSRSAVDLKNAEIASLIRNGDYSSALVQVEQLLADLKSSPEMSSLPESEQQQRAIELQARKRQLMQRAVRVDVPVQSQVVSPAGKYIAWGNQLGTVEVRAFSENSRISPAPIAEMKLTNAPATLTFTESEDSLLAAVGSEILVWNFTTGVQAVLSGHQSPITAVATAEDFAISTDVGGSIRGWSLETGQQLWSMRSSSRIVDLVLMPQDKLFIYAGSRGGESADILAYKLGGLSNSMTRPERLGQLKLSRSRNDPPRSLAVSPDGQKLLISNTRNGAVLVLPRRTSFGEKPADRFPFSHVTDLEDQQAEATWIANRHQRPVNEINFSSKGKRFCTASDDRTIGVWEFATDGTIQLVERLEGHGARVNGAVFTDAVGQQVSSVAADRYCRFWNVNTYKTDKSDLEREFQLSAVKTRQSNHAVMPILRHPILPQALAMSLIPGMPWRELSTTLSMNTFIADDESPSGEITLNQTPSLQRGAIQSVVVSRDGRLITTGGSDGTAVIWDTKTREPLNSVSASSGSSGKSGAFDEGHDFNVSRFRFLPPDGHHLLTTGFDGNLCLWNSNSEKSGTGHQTLRLTGLGLVNAIATSSDGQFVVMSSLSDDDQPGICRVYKASDLLQQADPSPVSEFRGVHTSEISAIAINSDGSRAVTGGRDGRIALWACNHGRLLAKSRIHTKNTLVSFLELFDDGTILTAGYDGRLMLLEVKTTDASTADSFTVVRRYQHDRIPIERVAVHPNRDRFVAISIRTDKRTRKVDYELRLWDLKDLKAQRLLKPAIVEQRPPVRISSVDFSPDGHQLAAVVDQRLQVFDCDSWKVVRVVSGGSSGMSDAIFAPPSTSTNGLLRLATFDGVAAQLWDLNSGRHLADFRPLFSVKSLARSEHERPLLLTGDRSIRFFQASTGDSRFGRCVFKVEDPHSGTVNAIKFCPRDPNIFASCGTDGNVCLWQWNGDLKEAVLQNRISTGTESESAVTLTWETNGDALWVASQTGLLTKYDITAREVAKSWPLEDEIDIADMDVRSDGKFVALCGKSKNGGRSIAWVFEQRESNDLVVHCTIEGHEAGGTRGIRFLDNSPYIATAGSDGACLLWNWMPERSSERPIQPYEAYQFLSADGRVAHAAPINAISVTTGGDVATVSDDGTAKLWKNPFSVVE